MTCAPFYVPAAAVRMEPSRDRETVQLLRSMPRIFSFKDYRTAMLALGFSAAYVVPFVVHVEGGRGQFAVVDRLDRTLHHRTP